MTGFGKAVKVFRNKKITAEIKSLNSKQVDLAVRLPQDFRAAELDLRSLVAQRLQRGKADLTVTAEVIDASSQTLLDIDRARSYKEQIERMSAELGIDPPADWYATLLRLPDVVCTEGAETEVDEAEIAAVTDVVNQAIDALTAFRTQEGARLQSFFEEKIAEIHSLYTRVEPYEQSRVEHIRARLIDNLGKLPAVDYDTNRLEQELIFYIEKLDITEEKIRLENHLKYFLETLHQPTYGQGKKLGFIAQELGREINTMGSKANQAELQQIVVMMKDQLEQIKEQVLNVL